jgi:hypothetical protein
MPVQNPNYAILEFSAQFVISARAFERAVLEEANQS